MRLESPSISTDIGPDLAEAAGGPAATFHLDGPTRVLDRRVHAYRADVADVALAGTLFAPHYAAPLIRGCRGGAAMMRNAPGDHAEAVSQLLEGEGFAILDIAGDWAWGYALHDHYVGYVRADRLGEPVRATHRVIAHDALIFSEASIKSRMTGTISFAAQVAGEDQGAFLAIDRGFVHHRHVTPIGQRAADPVCVAEEVSGMPYLWGGRGAGGIDCSGLVQVALAAAGVAAPRDTDQMRGQTGRALPDDARLRRGDIVFFPGHVGLMVDEDRLIHANAHWMAVTIEPLADVVARLIPHHDRPILARRRL